MKILLLEDEYSLRISIEEFLEDIGYQVVCFMDGEQALDAIFDTSFDVLLLDVNVSTLSGFELLKTIRLEGIQTPAIFLTAMTDMQNMKKGYETGCCDYIRKPFDLEELEIRLNQVIKSFYSYDNELIDLGQFAKYHVSKAKLTVNEEEVLLRKTEKDILELLIKHRNFVVSVELIQDKIWGEYVEPATIRVQLKNLRQKLPNGIIQNRRGLGYIIER